MKVGFPLPALDRLEERILRIAVRAGYENSRLSVNDVIDTQDLGAPGTLHSRLKSMREKDWIAIVNTEDGRRKQIALTDAALQILDEVGSCIAKAAKSNKT